MLTHIQNGFAAGEISPRLWGRTDLAKYHLGASTVRNMFVDYRGGASSRGGLAFVGMCKQGAPNTGGTSTANPPRDINFQFNLTQGYALEFGDQYMRVKTNGAYVTEAAKAITGATRANPAVLHIVAHGYSANDWLFTTGMGGMTEFNGLTWIVNTVPDADHVTLTDLFGAVIDSTTYAAYTSGGTAARIYTLATPYAAVDLPYLKFTQSADTMSLTCVNQGTLTEYAPYDLVRHAANSWSLTATTFGSSISPPSSVSVTAKNSTTVSTWYSYVVTSVDGVTSEESVASVAGAVENNDISVNAGSNIVAFSQVPAASIFNIYRATPSFSVAVPVGVSYFFVGQSFGGNFVDTNISADSTRVPPLHLNPFARSPVLSVNVTAQGSGYTQATVGYAITTATGSGAVLAVIVNSSGNVSAVIVTNGGSGYALADTVTITDSGTGTGATATLRLGSATGTYPGVVAYYQQRRVYANTLNTPNTYYMSQPGAYTNMDAAIPAVDDDAIVGTPWAQQINGIQFLVAMPGGLVTLSGSGAWQISGGTSSAITPADQSANPQAYNGCSATVAPVVANYDILYVQAKGSIVRDLSYNFFVNIYTGTDLTILSNHLFINHTILQWAYCEEPYKLIWCVRDDGVLLSLTYLKEQDIYAWARHDTNGLFVGVCPVTEPPVDALYLIVKRLIKGHWVYYSERMDNRLWETVEDCFCVDAGLSYPMTFPNATLTPAAAVGTSNISAVTIAAGGSNYVSPVATAVDTTGAGTGASFSVTVSGGVITAVTPVTQGHSYEPGSTSIVITDATGSGAVVNPVLTNNVVFAASASVFAAGMVGNVIRAGGGIATITAYTSGTSITANITQPITTIIPNDLQNTPVPAAAGSWSISIPTTTVSGLNHLEGLQVAILADGGVIPNQTVANGSIVLPQACSAITVGLPFTAQLQALDLDARDPSAETMQSKRKNIYAISARVEESRGFSMGANQPDASVQPLQAALPWKNMVEVKQRNALIEAGSAIPLFTGDIYQSVTSSWKTNGQAAFQQTYPLPLNVLSFVAYFMVGDTSA